MAMRIGKKFKSGRIGKKMRRVATIGGRGGIIYGKSLQGAGAVATAVGVPELGVPVMLAGKGFEVGGRATKKAGQGKSVSKIERRMTADLTGGLF
jgi:hypothetical protein